MSEVQQAKLPSTGASPSILLGMTAVTGMVDAVSFLALGHVFTANMTGNIVFFGFAIGLIDQLLRCTCATTGCQGVRHTQTPPAPEEDHDCSMTQGFTDACLKLERMFI